MPKQTLQCPFCSKKSTRGAGLASHIRSAHPGKHAVGKVLSSPKSTPKAAPAVPAKPAVVQASAKRGALERTQNAGAENPTANLLSKAYQQLSERRRAIEAELGRFDRLNKELETIDLQIASLKATLGVFEGSPQPVSSDTPEEPSGTQEPQPETPPKAAETEFTGNKRALVASIVESRGLAGVTPKEIEEVFAKRKIEKGRNLIYNALSLSVKDGRMRRQDGKYFPATRPGHSPKKSSRTSGK